ncbi:transcriptional regulator [Herbaspirillum sp. HC18]|nr:transcriptional regulator [Herbaspirillum sp. HC18]
MHESCTGNCSRAHVRDVVCRIGDKWAVYVVCTLKSGPLRFNELKRHVAGISQRMLALTLRELERDGLITRSVCRHVPVKVSYALTALGQTLVAPVCSLITWAENHLASIAESRRRFDRDDDASSE